MHVINFISFLKLIIKTGWFGPGMKAKSIKSIAIYLDNELYLAFNQFSAKLVSTISNINELSSVYPVICMVIRITYQRNLIIKFETASPYTPNEDISGRDVLNMIDDSKTDVKFVIMPEDIVFDEKNLESGRLESFLDLPVKYFEIEEDMVNVDFH